MKTRLIAGCISVLFIAACANPSKEESKEVKNERREDRFTEELQKNGENSKPKENPYKNAKLDIKVFNNDSLKQDPNLHGYGYDIYMFDALYVHQPHVPAINGNRGFHTRGQAQKTAEMVVYKIRNNIMPPSLTIEELDSLGALK